MALRKVSTNAAAVNDPQPPSSVTDELLEDKYLKRKKIFRWSSSCIIAAIGLLVLLIPTVLYVLFHLFPEYDMVVYSRCKRCHQLDTWGGKVFGIRLRPQGHEAISHNWRTDRGNVYAIESFAAPQDAEGGATPPSSSSTASTWPMGSLYSIFGITPGKRPVSDINDHFWPMYIFRWVRILFPPWSLPPTSPIFQQDTHESLRPIIYFGVHHKTGTLVAKKILGRICTAFDLCCVWRVTRDSEHTVRGDVRGEKDTFHMLGHSHWLWNPKDLGRPYLMVHFVRHPFRKIVSGFEYHRKGGEFWTTSRNMYNESCRFSKERTRQINENDIFQYCKSSLPCQTCCRIEHQNRPGGQQKYTRRKHSEYTKLCSYLKNVGGYTSLAMYLNQKSTINALRAEAALEFYENLRMARLYNETSRDPQTLNVDIDFLEVNFKETVRSILAFINQHLQMSPSQLDRLLDEMNWFDIHRSPLYQLKLMAVTRFSGTTDERKLGLLNMLNADKGINELYEPVFALYDAATASTSTS